MQKHEQDFLLRDVGGRAGRPGLAPNHWARTEFQVGGFGGASAVNNGDGTVTFTIPNDAGAKSFLYGVAPNRTSKTGPMRTISQTFQWTERIDTSKFPQEKYPDARWKDRR